MKKLALVIVIGLLYSANIFALSPEIKFDMLKTKLTKEFKAKQYSKAIKTMNKIKALGIKVPNSFDYFEGKALFELGKKSKSYSKLEKYINATGKRGKYYKQALSYLIEAEEGKAQEELLLAPKIILSFTRHKPIDEFWGRKNKYLWRYQSEITFSPCKLKTSYLLKKEHKDDYVMSRETVKRELNLAHISQVLFNRRDVAVFDSIQPTFQETDFLFIEKTEQEKKQFKEAIFILKEAAIEYGCKK